MSLSSRKAFGIAASLFVFFFLSGIAAAGESGNEIVYTASNTIAVVDVGAGEVLKEVPLEHFVTDIVFGSAGDRAYVATSNGVMVLDTKDYTVLSRLTDLPVKTLELSPDNTVLYAMDHPVLVKEDGSPKGGDYQIKAIDISTGKTVHSYVLGEGYYDFHLAADGRTLFALKSQSKEVDVIDTNSWQKMRTISIDADEPLWRSAGSREKGELYIPQYGSKGYLWVLDTGNDNVRKVELNEELRLRGIAFSSETNRLYLLSLGHILVIDATEGKVIKRASLDTPYQGMSCSNDGKKIYLSNPVYHKGGSIAVVDGESLAIEKIIDIPTISPIAIATRP